MTPAVDKSIQQLLNDKLNALEQHFQADILTYYGGSQWFRKRLLANS